MLQCPTFNLRVAGLFAGLLAGMLACAPLHPRTQPTNATVADRAAEGRAYACVLGALRRSELPVVKADSARGVVRALLREEVPAGDSRLSGLYPVGSPRWNDIAAPYLIDEVVATVTRDRGTGRLVVSVNASSGAGGTARGGYTSRPASDRAARAARAPQACGASL